jgi:hypothetical protein
MYAQFSARYQALTRFLALTFIIALWPLHPRLFFVHLQGIVRQDQQQMVPSGWDPLTRQRAMVQLAPLSEMQCRRREYFFPTVAEQQTAIARFESNERRLELKLKRLAEITGDTTAGGDSGGADNGGGVGEGGQLQLAKEEYDASLSDLRDKELQAQFGREQLVELKDEAKVLLIRLLYHISHLTSSIYVCLYPSHFTFFHILHLLTSRILLCLPYPISASTRSFCRPSSGCGVR